MGHRVNEKEFHKTGKAMEENMNFPNATSPATKNVPRRDDRTEQDHHYKNYKSVNPPNQQHHRKFEVVRNGQIREVNLRQDLRFRLRYSPVPRTN